MARAFGKVILFGEHAVVYGVPALAAALELGAEANAEPAAAPLLSVEPWAVSVAPLEPTAEATNASHPHTYQAHADQAHADQVHALARAFGAIVAGYGSAPALHVKVKLAVPSGAGLGGSAALSVAIVRALDDALGLARSPAEIAEHALRAERVFHGNPSGVDTAMAAHGGVALYRKARPIEPVLLKAPLWLVVGHSGEPGMTKETVASVGRQHAQTPDKTRKIFDAIAAIVQNGKSALERGDLQSLGELMELNQKLLLGLMVSTPKLEEMCTVAVKAGALGAKLTGGGGGGCMIALVRDRQSGQDVLAALEARGYKAFLTEVSP